MSEFSISCPRPKTDHTRILMGHGGGGRLMHQLIDELIRPALGPSGQQELLDAAVLPAQKGRLALTTDSFVVRPVFFPGGDIGQLAVHGTINDLCMVGARPLFLSLGLILEEGCRTDTVSRILRSVGQAAAEAGVPVVTGDTKVVDKGKGDQIYINTAGVGCLEHDMTLAPSAVRSGDAVIVNGDLGRHGMAIMAVREGLEFESEITSDTAPLWECVDALLGSGVDMRCLRDLTRGGLSSALNEIAAGARQGIQLDEQHIPVREDVRAACEVLGLDPLYVANEGRFVCFVAERDAATAVAALKKTRHGMEACRIGTVTDDPDHLVTLRSPLGHDRIIDLLTGDQLPRIC